MKRLLAGAVLALAFLIPAAPAAAQGTDLMSVEGAGPYRIGARLDALTAAGLISWVAEPSGCSGLAAGAAGEWAGKILLAFRNGRLVEIGTATVPPRSPDGASVGMRWDDLERIYGPRGRMIRSAAGEPAYVVRVGPRVELYTGHPIRAGVGYFQVGPANFVLRNFRFGPGC